MIPAYLLKILSFFSVLLFFSPSLAFADDDLKLSWSAFIDTYYAYDFNNPPSNSRNPLPLILFSQLARHNEFNINLAYFDVKATSDRIRSRLALQTGTSVPLGYFESSNTLTQVIQEAFIGYRISEKVWIDAGVFFSHIGFENWISKENWAYTRSLMADLSPYYQSGVRVTYDPKTNWSFQALLLNGWSNILEDNSGKAVGIQLSYKPVSWFQFTYNNFYGAKASNPLRFFNNFIFLLPLSEFFQLAFTFDIGLQKDSATGTDALWTQLNLQGRLQLSPKFGVTLRVERYLDPNEILFNNGIAGGTDIVGASIGADLQLHRQLLWRNEFRSFFSSGPIFPSSGSPRDLDAFLTTAMTLSLQ